MRVIQNPDIAAPPESAGARPYCWTVETFYRALSAGLFEHPERLELIKGEIIERMSPQDTPHLQACGYVYDVAFQIFTGNCHVRSQGPLDIGRATEPEPDVMVVRGARREYDNRKPRPSDLLLLVEVSDSTLPYDRGVKGSLYAEAGIAEYWIVNLPERCLEVYREPGEMEGGRFGYGYRQMQRYAETESVAPLSAPGMSVRVEELLPRAATTDPVILQEDSL
jgi:Uma2 family endonuclease